MAVNHRVSSTFLGKKSFFWPLKDDWWIEWGASCHAHQQIDWKGRQEGENNLLWHDTLMIFFSFQYRFFCEHAKRECKKVVGTVDGYLKL